MCLSTCYIILSVVREFPVPHLITLSSLHVITINVAFLPYIYTQFTNASCYARPKAVLCSWCVSQNSVISHTILRGILMV